jgi:hypothetical protein
MGIILNPRGAGGAGKTVLVRRLMAAYGAPAPLHRPGRARPIGYQLDHPRGGRPLVVIGAYEATRGGCDTIPIRDGGLAEATRLAAGWAAAGHDVLLEGLVLSGEHRHMAALAAAHPLHILHLATPPEDCARALIARRRARRDAWPALALAAARQQAEIAEACDRLKAGGAWVERLGLEEALHRARVLLGLAEACQAPAPQGGAAGRVDKPLVPAG